MTSSDEFRKRIYVHVRDRTVQIANGSGYPFISYANAKRWAKKNYDYDPQPTFLALKELENEGAITKHWDNTVSQYRFIAKI